jgi:large exoprotein involved in heme utilization and adhesion
LRQCHSITAPSGRIEIGAVTSGEVVIDLNSNGSFSLDYEKVSNRGDILLSRLSLLNASGYGRGDITLFGRNITLTDASLVLIANLGSTPSGLLTVNASNDLSVSASTPLTPTYPSNVNITAASGLRTQAFGAGAGADINIFARNLTLQAIARIYTQSYGSGRGGDIQMNITNSTSLLENPSYNPAYSLGSIIGTSGAGIISLGGAGNVFLATNDLNIMGGSQIGSTALQNAKGGDINIFTDKTNVSGYNMYSFSPSLIISGTQGNGRGGNLTLNTRQLTVTNGGRVDASTLASGSGGDLTINATDFINISGTIPRSINPTLISASANIVDPIIQKSLNLPAIPTGAAGNLSINTPRLSVSDGAEITVRADGPGKAGRLSITAQDIKLKTAKITASTQGGDGGTISITSSRLISQNSLISASARGNGNGGNISITSDVIFGDRKSYLRANAENGRGGEINVDTQGFSFPRENITAISTSGANSNGKVQINATSTRLSLLSLYKPPNVRYSFSTTCKPNPRKSLSVHGGSGMLPEQFDEPIENTINTKKTYYRLDLKTRKKILLGEAMLSWRDNGDGTGSPVSELPDPLSIASIPAFHCFDSSPVTSAKIK